MEYIELGGIIVGLMVIIIELIILFKLRAHSNHLDKHTEAEIAQIDAHVKKLKDYIQHLDEHTHHIEAAVDKLLEQTKDK